MPGRCTGSIPSTAATLHRYLKAAWGAVYGFVADRFGVPRAHAHLRPLSHPDWTPQRRFHRRAMLRGAPLVRQSEQEG